MLQRIAIVGFIFFLHFFAWGQDTSEFRPIRLGNSAFHIVEKPGRTRPNLLFLNLHEDESTSLQAIQAYNEQVASVRLVFLNHGGTRRVDFQYGKKYFSVDPNRIFTKEGLKKTLKDGGRYSMRARKIAQKLTDRILAFIEPSTVVVALHNNTNYQYSILSYLPNKEEAENASDVHINAEMDPDDFIFTTVPEYFDYLKSININVILQDNENVQNDGSLSVYCGKNTIKYINIEAEHDHAQEQFELIRIVVDMLDALEKN